jgi:heme oxygenase
MEATGNRFVLRDATRDEHQELDARVGHFDDIGAYSRYLSGMARFRGEVEPALSETDLPAEFGNWRPGLICRELERDLADLGCRPPPPAHSFALPGDVPGLLGVLYVLEGSALGARLLVRRAAALGLTSDHGARHLAAQTRRPDGWTGLVGLLDSMAAAGLERAITAARMTFAAAIQAYAGMGPRERAC